MAMSEGVWVVVWAKNTAPRDFPWRFVNRGPTYALLAVASRTELPPSLDRTIVINNGRCFRLNRVTVVCRFNWPPIVGLMGAAFAIPSVFGFLAGIAADRLDRRRLMLGIDIICAGLVICIAIIIALSGGVIVIAPLLILVFTISLLGEFYEPALFAYIPMLVDREKIVSANSLLDAGREGMIAAAKIIAGIIASLIGIAGLLVLND